MNNAGIKINKIKAMLRTVLLGLFGLSLGVCSENDLSVKDLEKLQKDFKFRDNVENMWNYDKKCFNFLVFPIDAEDKTYDEIREKTEVWKHSKEYLTVLKATQSTNEYKNYREAIKEKIYNKKTREWKASEIDFLNTKEWKKWEKTKMKFSDMLCK